MDDTTRAEYRRLIDSYASWRHTAQQRAAALDWAQQNGGDDDIEFWTEKVAEANALATDFCQVAERLAAP